jgi:hypothetical protein
LSDLRLLIFAFAIRAASALGDCFICAAIFAAFVDCGCATVSAPCSIGCTFMGPVAGGRSLAIPDNARILPLVSFLLPFLVRMHPKVRRYLAIGKPPSVNRVPSPLIVLMNQIGVNQVNVDGLPTYISSTAGGVQ